MLNRYRLYQLAVGGCLAAVLIFAPALAEDEEAVDQPQPQATETQQPKSSAAVSDDTAFWDDKKGDTTTYRAICDKPKNREYADLCQQWRVAEINEKQFELSAKAYDLVFNQFIATILEIVFLVLTAIAAIIAAIAAIRGATAAENALTKAQRPYVFVIGVKGILPRHDENQDGFIPYTITNSGQTPVIIEFIGALPSLGQTPKSPAQENEDHPLVVSPILEARERCSDLIAEPTFWIDSGIHLMPIVQNDFGEILPTFPKIPEGESLFFWVKVSYRGPFTKGHETSACWRYDTEVCQFIRYGGEEYNYTR